MNPETTPQNANLTPDAFKALIVGKYPNGVSSDGTPYSKMDATDLTKRIIQTYPDGTTQDGHKYSDYLPQQTQNNNQSQSTPWWKSALQGIANPIATVARLPVGLAEQGIGAATGNQGMKDQGALLASGKQINDPNFGQVNQLGFNEQGAMPVGQQIEQAGGIAAQLAPYAMGAGEVGSIAENAGKQTIGGLIKTGAKTGAIMGSVGGAGQAVQQGAEQGQDGATTAANAFIQGGEGAIGGGILGGGLGLTGGVAGKLSGLIGKDVPTQNAIDSINPELTGKKLASSYEASAKAGTYKGGSEAGISPRIQKAGVSLSDLGLNPADPRGNLVKLSKAMSTTEAKITPYENYGVSSGVKTVLNNDLDKLKTNTPREFSGIKDTQNAFNNVVDYAKELVQKTKDTIGGYRDARTSFDAKVREQFPNAFNDDGTVNLRTPLGAAVKATRDTLNDNLYSIAPKASNLQSLISREADIYNAMHNVAPKVAKLDGMGKAAIFIKNHPGLVSTAKTTAEIAGVGGAAGYIGNHLFPSGQQ